MSEALRTRKVQVTPELAKKWLATNQENRNISDEWVRKLARDMANDDWPNVGETLKFDTNGHLIDGQHRLMAVTLSGKTIEFFVVEGIPRNHRYRMDRVRTHDSDTCPSPFQALQGSAVIEADDISPSLVLLVVELSPGCMADHVVHLANALASLFDLARGAIEIDVVQERARCVSIRVRTAA